MSPRHFAAQTEATANDATASSMLATFNSDLQTIFFRHCMLERFPPCA